MDEKKSDCRQKKPLVVLAGPTAVGKTRLSIQLAKALNGEVISADSMQVYRHMDIGSAKITREEMEQVPHHLIDALEPEESFHVVRFQRLAKQALADIHARGRIPLLVGGTGFYIQAVVRDIAFGEERPREDGCRRRLERLAREKGARWLHEQLAAADPESARKIHPNNQKRVLRALEFYHDTGMPISAHNREQQKKESPYSYAYFVLTDDRETLYRRIDDRVDQMMANGLLKEVRALKERGCTRDMVSMQGLGYQELLAYLEGEYPLEEAIRLIKRNTRHFAKRQLTWFKREKDVIWVHKKEKTESQILEYMLEQCQERRIVQ